MENLRELKIGECWVADFDILILSRDKEPGKLSCQPKVEGCQPKIEGCLPSGTFRQNDHTLTYRVEISPKTWLACTYRLFKAISGIIILILCHKRHYNFPP